MHSTRTPVKPAPVNASVKCHPQISFGKEKRRSKMEANYASQGLVLCSASFVPTGHSRLVEAPGYGSFSDFSSGLLRVWFS